MVVLVPMKLFSYLKPYRSQCILAPVFKLFEVFLELLVPLVVASLIDIGITNGDVGHVVRMCLFLGGFAALGLGASFTAQYFSAKAATGLAHDVKNDLFRHIQRLSATDLDRVGTSTLLTRMTSDMNQVQSGVNMALRLLLRSPFVVFGAAFMAIWVDRTSAGIFLGALAVLLISVGALLACTIPMYRRVQQNLDKVLSHVRENLYGVRVLRAFCQERNETEVFIRENEALKKRQMLSATLSVLTNPLTTVIINIGIMFLIWTGGRKVDTGALSQGEVVALVNYMSLILVELVKLANLMVTISKALACARRIDNVFDLKPSQQEGAVDQIGDFDEASDRIVEFRNVTFAYNANASPALSDISFQVRQGETVGIIGGTGSGKSTIVSLLLRQYDATGGEVDVFGRNIVEYTNRVVHSNIVAVLQKAKLFKGTIRSNLKWGDPSADDRALAEALDIAQAREIVEGRPKGLDSGVEIGGRNFSGGQKQRLSIARALVAKPKLLILDDSTSALDYATDAALRNALKRLDCTLFIISQRTHAVREADQILVLDNGRLVGHGKHDELLKSCKVYQEIYDSQYSDREVGK